MTMILMYVSSQTVPESAIEDDGTKKNVPWIENLITKQCVLFCPRVGY